MSGVATAIAVGGAAVIGGVATYAASQNAANAQTNAANQSNNTQLTMFNQQQANEQPWLTAGSNALGQLQGEMPSLTKQFTMQDFQQDPGYQFDLNQGEQAMQRSAAAKGILNSAGTMQNLNNYAQGQASNEYSNAYNRFTQSQQQRYNMLAGIAGTGQTANGQINSAGQNAANNISANQIGAGNATAASNMAFGNTVSNLANTGANGYMNYNMMNNMFGNGGGGGSTMGSMASGGGSMFGGGGYNAGLLGQLD